MSDTKHPLALRLADRCEIALAEYELATHIARLTCPQGRERKDDER